MPPKLTLEQIRKKFEERNCILLSSKYENVKSILEGLCPNGHKFSIQYHSFTKGRDCSECSGNKKLTIEKLYTLFKERGYTLVSSKYINRHQDLEYICSKGHKIKTKYDNFQRKREACKLCKKYSYEELKNIYEKHNYILLSSYDEYKINTSYLSFKCPEGHIHKNKLQYFLQGQKCKECGIKKGKEFQKHKYDFILKEFEKRGYTLISDNYESRNKKLNYICSNGHTVSITYGNLKSGYGCPHCPNKSEQKCREIFEKYYSKPFPNCRPDFMERLELDGYNEELKIAFEYNGRQHYEFVKGWHKKDEDLLNQIARDDLKKDLCIQHDIKLYIIPYTVPFEELENFIHNLIKQMN